MLKFAVTDTLSYFHCRFSEEGELLTITNANQNDENTVYRCALATPGSTSITLTLRVHPEGWLPEITTTTALHQPQSQTFQNLIKSSSGARSSKKYQIEKISFFHTIMLILIISNLSFVLHL